MSAESQSLATRFRGQSRIELVRIGLGIALLGTLLEYLLRFGRVVGADVARVPYWSWFPSPSPEWAGVLAAIWLVSAYLFLTGRYGRIAASVLGLTLFCVLLTDRQWYSNHLYLLALVVPLAGWAEDDGELRSGILGSLIAVQVLLVYLFAGLAKLNGEFLSGSVLLNYLGGTLGSSLDPYRLLALGSVVAELGMIPLLLAERTRRFGVLLGILLHGAMLAAGFTAMPLIEKLGIANFGLAMIACYPAVGWLRDGQWRSTRPAHAPEA